MMKNILFIHQSAELYGSDKTLLSLVKGIKIDYNPIVVLPNKGPLFEQLEKEGIKVYIAPVLKISRKMFTPKNIFSLPFQIRRSYKILDQIKKQYHFEVVYSNTLAVLIGLMYARSRKLKHIWHVHEIIESPQKVTTFFRKILDSKSNHKIIYNSSATALFWNQKNVNLISKSVVIRNGVTQHKPINDCEREKIRTRLFKAKNDTIVLALVGRISRWKGQLLLLEAFEALIKKHQNIKLIFIGSPPPNQNVFLENLIFKINEYQLLDQVVQISFYPEIEKLWDAIDIAVVPSTEPEPFGLVAIEAMMAKKPVVGANHGGLTEIILNNETGFLVEPKSVSDLKKALMHLIENPSLRKEMGEKGFERAVMEFSEQKYIAEILNVFKPIKV